MALSLELAGRAIFGLSTFPQAIPLWPHKGKIF